MTPQDFKNTPSRWCVPGGREEGEALLRKLTVQRPTDSEIQEQLASIYASRKKTGTPRFPFYESLLQRDPNNAHWNLITAADCWRTRVCSRSPDHSKEQPWMPLRMAEPALRWRAPGRAAGILKKSAQEFARVLPQYDNDAVIVREYADLLLRSVTIAARRSRTKTQ